MTISLSPSLNPWLLSELQNSESLSLHLNVGRHGMDKFPYNANRALTLVALIDRRAQKVKRHGSTLYFGMLSHK